MVLFVTWYCNDKCYVAIFSLWFLYQIYIVSLQETLHPNSPTPLSAERCDSSLSNVDVCRICQCDGCEIQKDSPLVAPCLCSGSLKFVHQACLQKWIKSSDKLSCELCQFEYKMTKKTKPFREVSYCITWWCLRKTFRSVFSVQEGKKICAKIYSKNHG